MQVWSGCPGCPGDGAWRHLGSCRQGLSSWDWHRLSFWSAFGKTVQYCTGSASGNTETCSTLQAPHQITTLRSGAVGCVPYQNRDSAVPASRTAACPEEQRALSAPQDSIPKQHLPACP